MGPKLKTRGAASKRGKGHGPSPPSQDYDSYIEKFQQQKDVSPHFYYSLSDIQSMGLGFHSLLVFQKMDKFVGLKDSYDESQVKAFFCNAQRQDGVSFECPFKTVWVSLNPEKWDTLVGLDCGGVDLEAKETFSNYNKVDFVKSVSKTGFGELCYGNFSPLQLKCVDRMLHWAVVNVIMCKLHNYGRIDDYDLSIMW